MSDPGLPGVPDSAPLVVAGVGSSAGGLDALTSLIEGMPPDVHLALIVAQHVSANYKSMMTELLSRGTRLPVSTARDGEQLEPGHIYVCPPSYNITLEVGDIVRLSPVDDADRGLAKPSVDLLLESISDVKQENGIGIILSGTGTDGAAGIRRVRDANGVTIAQAPETAKYDGMPRAAIHTGRVDLVLAPEAMGVELQHIATLRQTLPGILRPVASSETMDRILRFLKRATNVSFDGYKRSTLQRRVERRIVARRTQTLESYEELLHEDPEEVRELFADLLIGVTEFFRDAFAWDALRQELTRYLENDDTQQLRCWIAGCSTGEEAYSLAILLRELLGDRVDNYQIQIFATDLNPQYIDYARRGTYPRSLTRGIPDELLEKHFVHLPDGKVRVRDHLQQMILFSVHNLAGDPPFLRQNLIVCRNVLIYFTKELQDAIFPVFAYALNTGGLLFLGQAETPGSQSQAFKAQVASAKLYRLQSREAQEEPPRLPSMERARKKATASGPSTSVARVGDTMKALIMEKLTQILVPRAVLLNASDDIVYAHGEGNLLLMRKPGIPSDSIFDNFHPDMVLDLRTTLHMLNSGQCSAKSEFRHITIGDNPYWARLYAARVEAPDYGDLRLIYCQLEEELHTPLGDPDTDNLSNVVALDQERLITKLREQLGTVVEQLENSNAEAQSLNEELQSANEELQSSNEELETTNEELQSTNEELQSAYAELSLAFDEKSEQERRLKQASELLRRSNELLEQAEAVSRTGSWRWSPSDNEFDFSQGACEIYALPIEQSPRSFDELMARVHRDDLELAKQYIAEAMQGQVGDPLSFRILRGDGGHKRIRLNTAVTLTEYGQVASIIATIRETDASGPGGRAR